MAWACLAVFLLHLFLNIFLTRQQALLPSGVLLLLENLAAAVACLWRARSSQSAAKFLWTLLGAAQLIHLAAGIEVGLEMVFYHLPHDVTTPSDFLIMMWGAPLLLALGSPTESRPSHIFYWLDGTQITLMMAVAFVAVFGGLPFQHPTAPLLSGLGSVATFSIENALILIGAGLRLRTYVTNRHQRSFFTCMFLALAIYAVTGPIYNVHNTRSPYPTIKLQCILAIHQLVMVLLAVRPFAWPASSSRRTEADKSMALFLDNSSPLFFPVFVVLASIVILPSHMRLGIAAILCSLLTYGIRSAIVQVQYQSIQTRMAAAQRQLERISFLDPLTEVPNRRTFDRQIQEAWRAFQETGEPFSLLLIDVDHFKILNDTRGHSEGDRCLRAIAKALQSCLHTDHLLARIGGEEFAAILRNTTTPEGVQVATGMMQAIATLALPNDTPIGSTVTVSIGLTHSKHTDSTATIFARADEALYCAKREGRHRIIPL